mgnify:CR=1 FL=1
MRIYLDVCCLNRPYDDQTQDRIHLEAEAVISILRHVEQGYWIWVSSGIVNYEVGRIADQERLQRLSSLIRYASEFVVVDENVRDRAADIQNSFGIKSYDAFHIACAEKADADVFLSTDDKLIRAAKRQKKAIKGGMEVENPLTWLQSIFK